MTVPIRLLYMYNIYHIYTYTVYHILYIYIPYTVYARLRSKGNVSYRQLYCILQFIHTSYLIFFLKSLAIVAPPNRSVTNVNYLALLFPAGHESKVTFPDEESRAYPTTSARTSPKRTLDKSNVSNRNPSFYGHAYMGHSTNLMPFPSPRQ